MPIFFNQYYPLRKFIFFLGEGFLIFTSLLFVDWWILGSGLFVLDFWQNSFRALLVTSIFQLCLYFYDQYDLSYDLSTVNSVTRLTQAFGVGCVILGIVYFSIPALIISTRIFWVGYLVIFCSVFAWRSAYYLILQKRLFVQNVLIIGTGTLADIIAREIEGKKDSVYRIKGFVGTTEPGFNPHGVTTRPTIDDFEGMFARQEVERIIVALDDGRGSTPIEKLLKCKMKGIIIEQGTSFYERVAGKILVERISPSWIIFSDGFTLNRFHYRMKRLMDLLLSSFLLVVSLPVILFTGLAVKLESSGPVFYLQERIGEDNKSFHVIKFRSMHIDAEKDGAVWAKEKDERITRVGAIIRNIRIDEIPQLWNVLKGEMSLVGPRPERRVFIDELTKKIPFYSIRNELKPGLTGWAQVCYPYGASEQDALKKLEYDLYYMKNLSIALDLLVVFKTIKTVLFQKGSR